MLENLIKEPRKTKVIATLAATGIKIKIRHKIRNK